MLQKDIKGEMEKKRDTGAILANYEDTVTELMHPEFISELVQKRKSDAWMTVLHQLELIITLCEDEHCEPCTMTKNIYECKDACDTMVDDMSPENIEAFKTSCMIVAKSLITQPPFESLALDDYTIDYIHYRIIMLQEMDDLPLHSDSLQSWIQLAKEKVNVTEVKIMLLGELVKSIST